MQSLNKKALGETIATFSLIILTIAAVSFAGWNVMHLLSTKADIQKSPPLVCLNEQISPQGPAVTIETACYNPDTNDIEIRINRELKEVQIGSLTFEFKDSVFKCENSCADCKILNSGTAKTYFFTLDNPQAEDRITLYANDCELDNARILDSC